MILMALNFGATVCQTIVYYMWNRLILKICEVIEYHLQSCCMSKECTTSLVGYTKIIVSEDGRKPFFFVVYRFLFKHYGNLMLLTNLPSLVLSNQCVRQKHFSKCKQDHCWWTSSQSFISEFYCIWFSFRDNYAFIVFDRPEDATRAIEGIYFEEIN